MSGTDHNKPQDTFETMTATAGVRHNLKHIADKIRIAYLEAPSSTRASSIPRLVAVSKTKHKELIFEAYEAGHRYFGENYVQELAEKSNDPELLQRCPDIKWHFIGNCQAKNVNKLAKCQKLSMIETITSLKLADKLQFQFGKNENSLVQVMVQVNTSGEENKNGIEPGNDTVAAAKHIKENCPNLQFVGLMTIGALGHSLAALSTQDQGPNPDFLKLMECRKQVAEALHVKEDSLELSMGMSNDFVEAIDMGSTNVRVGSSIFGARSYPSKPAATGSDKSEADKTEDSSNNKLDTDMQSANEKLSKVSVN